MSKIIDRKELGEKIAKQILTLRGEKVEERASLIIEGYLDMIYNEGYRKGLNEGESKGRLMREAPMGW